MARSRWLPLLPAALLLLLAAHQGWRVHQQGLTPWKGGGFGMFATSDGGHTRRLQLLGVDAEGRSHALELPAPLRGAAGRARSLPSDARLRQLARRAAPLVSGPWVALRVEVWRTRFDPVSLTPRFERLRAWEQPIGRGDS